MYNHHIDVLSSNLMAPIISVYNFTSFDPLTVRSIWNFAVPVFPGIIRSIELSESCYPWLLMGWQHLKMDYAMSAGIMSVENILEIVLKLWSTKKPSKRILEYLNFQKRVNKNVWLCVNYNTFPAFWLVDNYFVL